MTEEQKDKRKIQNLEDLLRERDSQLRQQEQQYYSLMNANARTLMDLQERTRERDSLICELKVKDDLIKKKDEESAYFMQQIGAKSKDYSCGYAVGSSRHTLPTTQFQPILQNFGGPYMCSEFPYAGYAGPQPPVQQVPYSHHTITTATLASTTLPFYSLATSTSSQVMSYQNMNLGPSNYPQQFNYGMPVPVCLQENPNVGPCSQTAQTAKTTKPYQPRIYATKEQKTILSAHYDSDPSKPSNERLYQYAEETKLTPYWIATWWERECEIRKKNYGKMKKFQ
uniref:Uncharacterized protein n=1 Tax=Meloidogyne incognita TaxID=6306 RepID=A0A914L893_MELIC